MTSIDNNLKSCSPHNDVYTYSFSKAEVDEINEGLKKNDWVTEVRQLIGEQEKEQGKQKIANAFDELSKAIKTNWLFRGKDGKPYREEIDKIVEQLKGQK